MFGGLAAYLNGKMVCVLMEDPGAYEYRGKKFDFEIWNGILIPMERENHASLIQDFPALVSHPVLGKWLYLPMRAPSFEADSLKLSELIFQNDQRIGILPQTKKKKNTKKKKKK
ncbi:MAG: hypothetical protein CL678_03095 [Bdellovibrionaceae bacterium]|nr:hypothetical protein [Pseudobdellovibrionaceae bacterium]